MVVLGTEVRIGLAHVPCVARVGVVGIEGTRAHRGVSKGDGRNSKLGASKHVSEKVDLDLDVLLRAQSREMATHQHVKIDSC